MEQKMTEQMLVERELNQLMEVTLRLECELDLAVRDSVGQN
jgi:hypothetical protein|tara:strand:+ start:1299 stop:1421 length:123 start_codon:yes stop_codon:yes gene_type:complete